MANGSKSKKKKKKKKKKKTRKTDLDGPDHRQQRSGANLLERTEEEPVI